MTRFCLVLHAHQPWLLGDGLAEEWLHEALFESYVPLLRFCEQAAPRLTLSLSPSLLLQWADAGFLQRHRAWVSALRTALAEEAGDGARALAAHAEAHEEWLWSRWRGHMNQALGALTSIELMTTTESHAILPLLGDDAARLRQLTRGRALFQEALDRAPPDALWLPECAYAPGLDRLIKDSGYARTVLDAEDPTNRLAVATSSAGLTCFFRDSRTAARVWSRDVGYPAHADYREFHLRTRAGVKLSAVSKKPWDPRAARARAAADAGDFAALLAARAAEPLIVAAYDAELFGHWWFEGPEFLAALFRDLAPATEAATLANAVMSLPPPAPVHEPSASSWGAGGHLTTWLNGENAWLLEPLHRAEAHLARAPAQASEAALRALARAESSDWPFMLTRGEMVGFATRRFRQGLADYYAG